MGPSMESPVALDPVHIVCIYKDIVNQFDFNILKKSELFYRNTEITFCSLCMHHFFVSILIGLLGTQRSRVQIPVSTSYFSILLKVRQDKGCSRIILETMRLLPTLRPILLSSFPLFRNITQFSLY